MGTALLIITLVFVLDPMSAERFKPLHQPDYVRRLLGWTEAGVCLLFIGHKTRYIGAVGLLIVFAFAAYLHLKAGLHPFGLLIWTVGILFVLYCDKRRKASATKPIAAHG